jgi:large subunit ribosomal protein L25
MSAILTYSAQPRTATGSSAASKLRSAGQVPVTISRKGHPSQHVSFDLKSAANLAAHVIHLCKVEVGGKTLTALRSQIAKDCLTDKITHIDLLEVDEASEIKVDVSVVPDARNCPGVKAGGIVEQHLRKVKVKCKANAIPDSIPVDLGAVELTETVYADRCVLPKGVTLVTPARQPLLSVVITRGMKTAEAEATAAAAAGADGAAPAAAGAPAAAAGGKAAAGAPAAAAGGKAAPAAAAKDAPKKK